MSSDSEHAINVDLAKVMTAPTDGKYLRTLAWGDYVEVEEITSKFVRIKTVNFVTNEEGTPEPQEEIGYIVPSSNSGISLKDVVIKRDQSRVLKVNFVDVQQGDGSVIETPGGKVILIDGGDNELFARYLAARYRGTSVNDYKEIDCILVTHGDADHFLGLTEIHKSERNKNKLKRLFIHPRRVYHNGLVKGPSKDAQDNKIPDTKMLGTTKKVGEELFIIRLVDDLLNFDTDKMNSPFQRWQRALAAYTDRGEIDFRRLSEGDNQAFDFLKEDDPRDAAIKVEVLGPLAESVDGKPGLRFLRTPPKGPRVSDDSDDKRRYGSYSASHTINGHSVILRLTYGNFRFLFAGDLNEEAEEHLVRETPDKLQAEVFKVPHHGSHDFSPGFLNAVSPVISVISSGDESARKEYMHPRANLVGALGRYSRVDEPLLFVTEMVAFFNVRGYIDPECHLMKKGEAVYDDLGKIKLLSDKKRQPRFFAFSRTAFGIVKTRTDGQRLLVYTDSGNVKLKEAYAFNSDSSGKHTPTTVRQV